MPKVNLDHISIEYKIVNKKGFINRLLRKKRTLKRYEGDTLWQEFKA